MSAMKMYVLLLLVITAVCSLASGAFVSQSGVTVKIGSEDEAESSVRQGETALISGDYPNVGEWPSIDGFYQSVYKLDNDSRCPNYISITANLEFGDKRDETYVPNGAVYEDGTPCNGQGGLVSVDLGHFLSDEAKLAYNADEVQFRLDKNRFAKAIAPTFKDSRISFDIRGSGLDGIPKDRQCGPNTYGDDTFMFNIRGGVQNFLQLGRRGAPLTKIEFPSTVKGLFMIGTGNRFCVYKASTSTMLDPAATATPPTSTPGSATGAPETPSSSTPASGEGNGAVIDRENTGSPTTTLQQDSTASGTDAGAATEPTDFSSSSPTTTRQGGITAPDDSDDGVSTEPTTSSSTSLISGGGGGSTGDREITSSPTTTRQGGITAPNDSDAGSNTESTTTSSTSAPESGGGSSSDRDITVAPTTTRQDRTAESDSDAGSTTETAFIGGAEGSTGDREITGSPTTTIPGQRTTRVVGVTALDLDIGGGDGGLATTQITSSTSDEDGGQDIDREKTGAPTTSRVQGVTAAPDSTTGSSGTGRSTLASGVITEVSDTTAQNNEASTTVSPIVTADGSATSTAASGNGGGIVSGSDDKNVDESPTPESEGDAVCFPASATVELASGAIRRMKSLQIGDKVLTSVGKYSEVFGFTHRLSKLESHRSFVQLTSKEGETSITLTRRHHIYLNGNLMASENAKVGDMLTLGSGKIVPISKVSLVMDFGLYNPQTIDGDIVVDGVVASTYTRDVDAEIAHAGLAIARAVYNWFGIYTTAFEDRSHLAKWLPSGSTADEVDMDQFLNFVHATTNAVKDE